MNINEFRKVLAAFADEPSDVDIRLGRAVFQIRDDLIDVAIEYSKDEAKQLLVVENQQAYPARTWVLNRVARLPQLADRIIATINASGVTGASPFVMPAGRLTPDLGVGGADEAVVVSDAVDTLLNVASNQLPGATSVLYLTSDAGEGKTTVINRVALLQAQRYKQKKTSTLVVPIPLSGRAFLTFDDAVIAALVNKLRFNYFYFDAFLALVRLGAIVPAFDGYEEMLVEGSKGEAVSALGGLVQSLDSSGAVLIAARKAFFDYLSFKSQARLLDAIGNHSASFSRLELSRWSREQFCDYGKQRGTLDADGVYQTVAARLGSEHPLLTRAVLVRRLFDVVGPGGDREELASLLGSNPQDYFFTFVDAIVKREASEKWLARISGDVMEPLLEPAEHHDLLAQIAVEMWQSSATALKLDVLDVLVDIFCEGRKKSSIATRQIKERVKQHSLLATDISKGVSVSFDHEDFQDFYFGEGLGRLLAAGVRSDLYSMLTVNVLSAATIEQSVQYLMRMKADLILTTDVLKAINAGESGFSFCKENCASLVLRLTEFISSEAAKQHYKDMYFPADGLVGRSLRRASFENCHFQPTSTANAQFEDIEFLACEFERLDVDADSDALAGCSFVDCRVDSLLLLPGEESLFDPMRIRSHLHRAGAHVVDALMGEAVVPFQDDERLRMVSRFLRIFLRTTQVNEDVIRLRLGNAVAAKFVDEVLPILVSNRMLSEVPWEGRGVQRRYRLTVPMAAISKALEECHGSFDEFLIAIRRLNGEVW